LARHIFACYAAQILGGFFRDGYGRRFAGDAMNKSLTLIGLIVTSLIVGCASGPAPPTYPAFVISDELPDIFMAAMPGVRAKEYADDAKTRNTSKRIDLPPDWSGTTGGLPGKSLEIFVVSGKLQLADLTLPLGGYAYVPPGTFGFNMQTEDGATILYFLKEFDADALIRTPLILDSNLVDWEATDTVGVFRKELRFDPGNGSQVWLTRVEPGAQFPWESSSVRLEGYLVSGQFQDSECVDGEPYTDVYLPGGYFRRPSESVHGGPAAIALSESIWFLRESSESTINFDVDCVIE
jgi:hypothetical protein